MADMDKPPAVLEAFLLVGGASLAMILVAALATAGFRKSPPESLSQRSQMRGSALNMLSVGLGVAAAWGLAALLGGPIVWLAAGFAAILVYLTVESLEYAATLAAK